MKVRQTHNRDAKVWRMVGEYKVYARDIIFELTMCGTDLFVGGTVRDWLVSSGKGHVHQDDRA